MSICSLGDLLLDVIVLTEGPVESDSEGSAQTRAGLAGNRRTSPPGRSSSARKGASSASGQRRRKRDRGGRARGTGRRGRRAGRRRAKRHRRVAGGRRRPADDAHRPGRRAGAARRGARDGLVRGCDVLHLSGYSLFRNPIAEAAAKAAGAVQTLGGRLSVDLSSATGIEAVRDAFLRRLELLQPDIVFGNESELAALGA